MRMKMEIINFLIIKLQLHNQDVLLQHQWQKEFAMKEIVNWVKKLVILLDLMIKLVNKQILSM